jgi:hypothetical protein
MSSNIDYKIPEPIANSKIQSQIQKWADTGRFMGTVEKC